MFQTWKVVQAAQGGGPIWNLRTVTRKEVRQSFEQLQSIFLDSLAL